MELETKLKILSDSAKYDICGDCFISREVKRVSPVTLNQWIYPTMLPDGRKVKLFKVLMSNACENDCAYCPFNAYRRFKRTSFTKEELATYFMELVRKGIVSGLFLSSGIRGNPEKTMQEMIETVEIIRKKYQFRGYIHLKILPGVSRQTIEEAFRLASRISINLEVPDERFFKGISQKKKFSKYLLSPLLYIDKLKKEAPRFFLKDGFTTQFVVGVSGEKDIDILKRVWDLYTRTSISRVYYSAFHPIPGTPLEGKEPTPPLREHRLYQVDYLFRKYGFELEELVFSEGGNLILEKDPKTVWAATKNRWFFPVEINRADYEELIRVPGIGPKSAKKIIKLRQIKKINSEEEFLKIGKGLQKSLPYITINGQIPYSQRRKIVISTLF